MSFPAGSARMRRDKKVSLQDASGHIPKACGGHCLMFGGDYLVLLATDGHRLLHGSVSKPGDTDSP